MSLLPPQPHPYKKPIIPPRTLKGEEMEHHREKRHEDRKTAREQHDLTLQLRFQQERDTIGFKVFKFLYDLDEVIYQLTSPRSLARALGRFASLASNHRTTSILPRRP